MFNLEKPWEGWVREEASLEVCKYYTTAICRRYWTFLAPHGRPNGLKVTKEKWCITLTLI